MIYIKNYIRLVFALMILGCANIVPPGGGERDHEPPRLISSNPDNKSINVSPELITLEFNEYVQVKNKSNIKISPFCECPLDIVVRGKKVEIRPCCPFDKLATYTIHFGQSVVDLNEGNVLENFTYVFSSGGELDSINLSGNVVESYSNVIVSDAMIGLYKDDDLLRPYYYANSDLDGNFVIKNIKNGEYLLFAFSDKNQNFQYDFGELVSTPFRVENFDSTKSLKLFYESDSIARINAKNINQNTIRFEHNLIADSIIILNTSGFWNRNDLWSEFWFNNEVSLIKYQYGELEDSVAVYSDEAGKINLNRVNNIEEIVEDQSILIKSTSPIKEFLPKKFSWKNSNQVVVPSLINFFTLEISLDSISPNINELVVDSGAIVAENNLKNDSISFLFDFDTSHYGSLILDFINFNENMIIEIYNDAGFLRKHPLTESNHIKYIPPGNYSLRVFHDIDNNNYWTPGIVHEEEFEEFVYVHPEIIKIKANWEIELLIRF